jgi:hypothetical protein
VAESITIGARTSSERISRALLLFSALWSAQFKADERHLERSEQLGFVIYEEWGKVGFQEQSCRLPCGLQQSMFIA